MTDDVKAGYVVLRALRENEMTPPTWEELAHVEASTPQAAIKAATDSEGTFVAVPARSFKPTLRKREQITKDVWE